ncbi:hypothetical protein D9613_009670 [Agrocybe pediades]|uniref:F-box domain-containing protein n=1 Tax=Agrocybe pediades TaxID=84607 RepID=A0A8H4QX91_9AGAR|nr:hypothetical protein D9613_009670 [Agrocybe pediades]
MRTSRATLPIIPLTENIWRRLPIELIREILLLLAKSNLQTARKMRLVCQDVNIMVLPILFRDIYMVRHHDIYATAQTLSAKREPPIRLLKSRFPSEPRPLSSYRVESWALVVEGPGPSMDSTLESIAPVFVGLNKIAISSQNLNSIAYWLRKHPILPAFVMLVHFGRPIPAKFSDPLFWGVTHLYTSTLRGYSSTTVANLPNLTHLAVSCRSSVSEATLDKLEKALLTMLKECKKLALLVLMMHSDVSDDEFNRKYSEWKKSLKNCLLDKRFILCGDFRLPRMEWRDIVEGKPTLWNRAKIWRRDEVTGNPRLGRLHDRQLKETRTLAESFPPISAGEDEWEIDIVESSSYKKRNPDPDYHEVHPHRQVAAQSASAEESIVFL